MGKKVKFLKSRRRKPKGQVNAIVSRPSTGLPASWIMKHKYVISYAVTMSTSPDTKLFNLNDLFLPTPAGATHQPYYYDQMVALYNKYTVYGVGITVKATCATSPVIIGVKSQRDQTLLAAGVDGCERPDVKYAMLNPGGRGATLSMYVNLGRVFGITKKQLMGDGEYSAAGGATPVKNWYLQCFAQHPDSATACSAYYTVELVYYTRWSERIRVAQS